MSKRGFTRFRSSPFKRRAPVGQAARPDEKMSAGVVHRVLLTTLGDVLEWNLIDLLGGLMGFPFPYMIQSLCSEQRMVAFNVMRGNNQFITGDAGVGKTHLLKALVEEYEDDNDVLVTASTGTAAILIGGTTIHSALHLGIEEWTVEKYLAHIEKTREKFHTDISESWTRVKRLFIDEISMISAQQWDTWEKIARTLRRDPRPFGGIQLIACGDFLQIRPVYRPNIAYKKPKMTVDPSDDPNSLLAFQAKSWSSCFPPQPPYCAYLKQPHRQSDPSFLKLLNDLRYGHCSTDSMKILSSRCNQPISTEDGILPTYLYSKHVDVDSKNASALEQLDTKLFTCYAQDFGDSNKLKHSQLPVCLQLKKGAQVMHLINNPSESLSNGLKGRVVNMDEKHGGRPEWVDVLFTGHTAPNHLEPYTQVVKMRGRTVARRIQFPICLAYATTIHKSQGQSLSKVCMKLDDLFEKGQFYVAISRATSLSTLSISHLNYRSIKTDTDARTYMKRLEESCVLKN